MLRLCDVLLAIIGLVVSAPLFIMVALGCYLDTGSPIFRQTRVGRHKQAFTLIKFRTMTPTTESVASHLVDAQAITPFGCWLRKSKIDELPQLINVLKGEMSLVGPRPNLFNQHAMICARDAHDIYAALPGITGLAQLHRIDMSTPDRVAETDRKMLDTLTVSQYCKYIAMTFIGLGGGDAVKR